MGYSHAIDITGHVYCNADCVNCPGDPLEGTKVHSNSSIPYNTHGHMCVCLLCDAFYRDSTVF